MGHQRPFGVHMCLLATSSLADLRALQDFTLGLAYLQPRMESQPFLRLKRASMFFYGLVSQVPRHSVTQSPDAAKQIQNSSVMNIHQACFFAANKSSRGR